MRENQVYALISITFASCLRLVVRLFVLRRPGSQATELDDLATRKKTWEKADAFCRHDQKIRAAHRYSQLTVKKDGPVGELKDKLRSLGKKLEHVEDLISSFA